MKKVLVISLTAAALIFSGCASSSGLSVNTIGKPKVVKEFKTGEVVSTKKVLVDDTMTAVVSGAAAGAGIGAVSNKNHLKGVAVGTIVGAAAGALLSNLTGKNEVEAYETKIKSNGKIYIAYIKKELPTGTLIEFVDRGNKITNVNVKELAKPKVITKTKVIEKPVVKKQIVYKTKIVEKPVIKKEVVVKEKIVYKEKKQELQKNKTAQTTKQVKNTEKESFW